MKKSGSHVPTPLIALGKESDPASIMSDIEEINIDLEKPSENQMFELSENMKNIQNRSSLGLKKSKTVIL